MTGRPAQEGRKQLFDIDFQLDPSKPGIPDLQDQFPSTYRPPVPLNASLPTERAYLDKARHQQQSLFQDGARQRSQLEEAERKRQETTKLIQFYDGVHAGDPNYDPSWSFYNSYGETPSPPVARELNRNANLNFNRFSRENLTRVVKEMGQLAQMMPSTVMAGASQTIAEASGMPKEDVDAVGEISRNSPGVQFAANFLPIVGQVATAGAFATPVAEAVETGSFEPLKKAGADFLEGMNVFRGGISPEERFIRALNLGTLAIGVVHGRGAFKVGAQGVRENPLAYAHAMETLVRTDPEARMTLEAAGIHPDDYFQILRQGAEPFAAMSGKSKGRGNAVPKGSTIDLGQKGLSGVMNTIDREANMFSQYGGSLFDDPHVLNVTRKLINSYPERFFEHLKLAIEQDSTHYNATMWGGYDPVNSDLVLFRELGDGVARQKGAINETIAHEFAHHLQKYIPDNDFKLLYGQYLREKARRTDRGQKQYHYESFSEWWAYQVTEREKVTKIYPAYAAEEPVGLRRAWAKSRVAMDYAVHAARRRMIGGPDYLPMIYDAIRSKESNLAPLPSDSGRNYSLSRDQLLQDFSYDYDYYRQTDKPLIKPWRPKY